MENITAGEAPVSTEELLRKFCAHTEIRYYMLNPVRRDGFLYATNGHIAVRIPDDPSVKVGEDNPNVDFDRVLKGCFEHTDAMEPINVDLPEPQPCKTCDGTRKVVECDICDGEGEFEHGSHWYDCRECNGSGYLDRDHARHGKLLPCPDCDGTGHRWSQVVKIGHQTFARRYVALLMSLPGVRIWTNPDNAGGTAFFAFDGGIGAVMPFRGD